ncbi:MAG: SRPBCC domain-containing protein [Ramlibacter sp.]|nr:SRPBCC domain-containing protein [Ramlibacter sp.]MBX3659368.1 SRPBCC domain-containing protein [Ramlibacter sp.]MCW5650729.1 SRPBCC domain-containing protein [Ramlibacter sp.]
MPPTTDPAATELVITRLFNAPRQLVYEAWTRPEHLAHWSGPEGFTTPHHEMDLRVGGRYRACLRSPDGQDHWVQGVYRELRAPERLSMTHAWEDASGQPGLETLVTVTFTDQDGQTLMTFHQAAFESSASRDGHEGGWSSSFHRLAAHLAALRSPAESH